MGQQDDYAPPPGPPPGYRNDSHQSTSQSQGWSKNGQGNSELASNNPFRTAHANPQGTYPSRNDGSSEYAPPLGPPPGYSNQPSGQDDHYISGKSDLKSNEPAPPPYDPWLAVPDTSLLPPPPSIGQEFSPTANASYDDAARGHAYIRANPLWQPRLLNDDTLSRMYNGIIQLTTPPGAKHVTLHHPAGGKTHLRSTPDCTDTIFLSDVPLFAAMHQPRPLQQPITIYYELQVIGMGSGEGDAGIAIGFVAPPYPSWRLPGWHRGSLGVHGDDGHRYVDNSYGGQDFTSVFGRGQVVGIGLTISPPLYANSPPRVQVFFTRNGQVDGGWDLHEELDADADAGDVRGLEGFHDILAAVGCFGPVEFEVRFRREDWLWKG